MSAQVNAHGSGAEGNWREGTMALPTKAAARAAARAARAHTRTDAPALLDRLRTEIDRVSAERGVLRLRIAAFASYGSEPDTTGLIDALLAHGHEVVIPRMRAASLEWVLVDAQTMYDVVPPGIREPRGRDVGLSGVDIVLLPALGVSRDGDRLGQGGGFYDRSLSGLRPHAQGGPKLIAIVFGHQVHDAPPWVIEPHDIRVDCFIIAD